MTTTHSASLRILPILLAALLMTALLAPAVSAFTSEGKIGSKDQIDVYVKNTKLGTFWGGVGWACSGVMYDSGSYLQAVHLTSVAQITQTEAGKNLYGLKGSAVTISNGDGAITPSIDPSGYGSTPPGCYPTTQQKK